MVIRRSMLPAGVLALAAASLTLAPAGAAAEARGALPPRPDGARIELAAVRPFQGAAVDVVSTPTGDGAYVVYESGDVAALGAAVERGARPVLADGETVAALLPSAAGYLLVTDRGRVFARGDAVGHGGLDGVALNGPIVDAAATPSGLGYWMLGDDGGVFAFGDAEFHGSTGDLRLNAPADGLVPDPDGDGYWFVASDGGVFAFDATFRGSMGATPLNRPVVAMVSYGDGYALVAEDGGTFVFSDAAFHGSLGGVPDSTRDDPVVGASPLPDGSAYVLLHRSGRLTSFGTHPAWITEGDDPTFLPTSIAATWLQIPRFGPFITISADGASGTTSFYDPPADLRGRCSPGDVGPVILSGGTGSTCGVELFVPTSVIYVVYDGTASDGSPLVPFVLRVVLGDPPASTEREVPYPLDVTWEVVGQTSDAVALILTDRALRAS
jgi:hypothetical protein